MNFKYLSFIAGGMMGWGGMGLIIGSHSQFDVTLLTVGCAITAWGYWRLK